MQTTYSVRELNAHIRQMFERDDDLQDIWVEGEVSGFKRAEPSGHCYFTLKDGKAQIDCAMWRSSAQQQAVLPKDGDAVLAHGYVTIYEERSNYQFYVDRIRPVGIGDLYRQFELLKQKLEAEGLVRRRTQATAARLPAHDRRRHLGERRRFSGCAERAAPPLPAGRSPALADAGAGHRSPGADRPRAGSAQPAATTST